MTSSKILARKAKAGEPGRYWYTFANEWVKQEALKHNTTPERVAYILAATSPKVSVTRNVKFTRHYLKHGTHLKDCLKISQNNVTRYETTGEISGQKINAFAQALLLDQDAIVLDVWMARALNVSQQIFSTKKVEECKRRVRKAAEILGWTPCQTQAAIWYATIKEHNRTPQGIEA